MAVHGAVSSGHLFKAPQAALLFLSTIFLLGVPCSYSAPCQGLSVRQVSQACNSLCAHILKIISYAADIHQYLLWTDRLTLSA